jgi:hypothetical protein
MYGAIERYSNNWLELSLAIREDEIDKLIMLLQHLKQDTSQHFHLGGDYKGKGGIADIEIGIQPKNVNDNLKIIGLAIPPNR